MDKTFLIVRKKNTFFQSDEGFCAFSDTWFYIMQLPTGVNFTWKLCSVLSSTWLRIVFNHYLQVGADFSYTLCWILRHQ